MRKSKIAGFILASTLCVGSAAVVANAQTMDRDGTTNVDRDRGGFDLGWLGLIGLGGLAGLRRSERETGMAKSTTTATRPA